jgi:hypothetical protein
MLLAKVTPDAVTDWKRKVISESGTNPVEQTRARRNVNSFIRNARALFSRKVLKILKEKGVQLPRPLSTGDIGAVSARRSPTSEKPSPDLLVIG